MSLKSKIEAVIYASEEPVTLQQLVGLLAGEAQGELDALAANQGALPLDTADDDAGVRDVLEAGTHGSPDDAAATGSAAEQLAVQDGTLVQSGTEGVMRVEGTPSAAQNDSPETAPAGPPAAARSGAEGSAETGQEIGAETAAETAAETGGETTPAGTAPSEEDKRRLRERERAVRDHIRWTVDQLIREYAENDRGIEIREVASGFRMGTKPEFHDAVRGFVKSLKPALRLTLPALETLAVVAYKQPVTAAEISEIRGVDSSGVLGGLMTRKLIATAGRKQVIGRPMLYKTTRDFLLRFGLKDVSELPSMEEFERMAGELVEQEDLPMENTEQLIEEANARGDAEHIRDANAGAAETGNGTAAAPGLEPGLDNDATDTEGATAEIAAGGNDEEDTGGTGTGSGNDQDAQDSAGGSTARDGEEAGR